MNNVGHVSRYLRLVLIFEVHKMILKALIMLVMLGSALGGSGKVTETSNLRLFRISSNVHTTRFKTSPHERTAESH